MPSSDDQINTHIDRTWTRADFLKGVAGVTTGVTLSGALAACGGSSSSTTSSASHTPRRGGTLNVAYIGGGTSETLDPNGPVADIDDARAENLFDPLVALNPDLSLAYYLAESFEPNRAADEWTIRLRSGVTFHDGSPLTADDVLFTLRRIADPKLGLVGLFVADFINVPGMRKVDPLTLRVPLTRANVEFPYFVAGDYMSIIKNGTTSFDHPVGTGPFRFEKWKAGQYSLFSRNPDYWQHGTPYVDALQLLSIPDATARYNALLSGQVDAIESISYAEATSQKQAKQITVLEAQGANMVPIYMAVDSAPFDDVRVRQAMRLIANRSQLVEQAQSGYGTVGNDIFGKGLPHYDTALPQREQDIEQAKSLLKSAGREGLKVTLYTSTVATGMLESATVFAQQAAAAGVTVSLDQQPASLYFGPVYLKENFAQSEWFTEPLVTHYAKSLVNGAPFNETHYHSARFQSLYDQTLAEFNPGKQQDLYNEMQSLLWNEGGYLIWGFYPLLDGLGSRVRNMVPSPAGPLGAKSFGDIWLAA